MRGPKLQSLLRILDRQDTNRFLSEYVPSTKATREEAPSQSWATSVYVKMLDRRIHLISHKELRVVFLALHHPNLADIHEQKMLHTKPAPHPLLGFPGYYDASLEPVKGTLSVVSRLNCRQAHPKVTVVDADTGKKAPAAFPYQGDLLLFIRRGRKIQLINWPVKADSEGFSEPEAGSDNKEARERQKLYRRRRIEALYYDDINVPTVEIAADKIPDALFNNLRTAFVYAQYPDTLSQQNRAAALATFRSAISNNDTATNVLAHLAQDGICTVKQGRDLFYQSIWSRSLRLDLFSNIVLDAPLRPERQDVFHYYQSWFPNALPSDIVQSRVA